MSRLPIVFLSIFSYYQFSMRHQSDLICQENLASFFLVFEIYQQLIHRLTNLSPKRLGKLSEMRTPKHYSHCHTLSSNTKNNFFFSPRILFTDVLFDERGMFAQNHRLSMVIFFSLLCLRQRIQTRRLSHLIKGNQISPGDVFQSRMQRI